MIQSEKWMPSASITNIKQRAIMLKKIREFFELRDVLEVETPMLSHYGGTEPNLSAITANYQFQGKPRIGFLQTSPEFAMKRLLAAGIGDCYQVFKAFRNEESGRFHNPEFSLLEWYRTGINEIKLLEEIDIFLQQIIAVKSAESFSYSDLFKQYLNLDPLQTSFQELQRIAPQKIENPPILDSSDEYLELLFSYCIEPFIGKERPCFVTHYPASQASLARISEQDPNLSCRFEIYFNGTELGNGFYELCDADEQLSRFQKENQQRKQRGFKQIEIDPLFIQALKEGLPESAGVAIGIDRLLMIATSSKHIDEVLSFPIDRA
jgi:lysyl-tRNA synthetase class 2